VSRFQLLDTRSVCYEHDYTMRIVTSNVVHEKFRSQLLWLYSYFLLPRFLCFLFSFPSSFSSYSLSIKMIRIWKINNLRFVIEHNKNYIFYINIFICIEYKYYFVQSIHIICINKHTHVHTRARARKFMKYKEKQIYFLENLTTFYKLFIR